MWPYNYLHVYCHSRAKIQRETEPGQKNKETHRLTMRNVT